MKSYAAFKIDKLPSALNGSTVEHVDEDSTLFSKRKLRTSLRLVSPNYHGFKMLEIEHSFQRMKPGRALAYHEGMYEEVKFTDYIEDVSFKAYYQEKEQVIFFEARKELAVDVYKSIKGQEVFKEMNIQQKEVDFDLLEKRIKEYETVWFNKIKSGGVHSASLSGTNLKKHQHYTDYKEAGGKITFVSFPFLHDDTEHSIGVTSDSVVVLRHNYNNVPKELEIISSVVNELLKPVWDEMDLKIVKE